MAAAFIAYCSEARVIDGIKVGDWLLHHGQMTVVELVALAQAEPWRAGAQEALWVSNELCADSRSLKESEMRSILTFAGLPAPECNATLHLGGAGRFTPDLLYRLYGSPWSTKVVSTRRSGASTSVTSRATRPVATPASATSRSRGRASSDLADW